jgi:geranylgeranyl diphosphate synthase, type I
MTVALPATLERSRDLVEPHLRAAVDRLDEHSRQVAAYHHGWIEADGRPAAGGGKAIRPALALLSASAAGASAEVGIPGAVAVELVHNFSLLHDDLMDHDVQRRHRATVWAVWGPSTAILVGDAMLALAQQVLADVGGDAAVAAIALLGGATQELIRGQMADLAFERRTTVSVEECVSMAAGKTGALLACATAIGAVLAGAPAPIVAALQTFGDELGLAFQLVDDLLGIWGDTAVTGKPVGSDLRARKKSLPIAYAISSGTPAGDELTAWLNESVAERGDTDEQIEHAAQLVDAAGGRQWAQTEAEARLAAGARALASVELDQTAREELMAMGRFVLVRNN